MNYFEPIEAGRGDLIVVDDMRDLVQPARMARRLPADLASVSYEIIDRRRLREHGAAPVTTHDRVHTGGIYVTRITDRLGTAMRIGGSGLDRYWFALADAGSMAVRQGSTSLETCGTAGLALFGRAGTHLLSSNDSIRTNLWIDADILERALSNLLGDAPGPRLKFRPELDWSRGLALSLHRQINYFASELRRPAGLWTSPAALASLNDLLLNTLLLALPHSHSERLAGDRHQGAPRTLSRAEAFMRAHATEALRMAQVAQAAGCSVRALGMAFGRFRGTTPLEALRSIRLGNARDELLRGGRPPVSDLALRHGFSNAGRFARAYRRQFGEPPSETLARTSARVEARAVELVATVEP